MDQLFNPEPGPPSFIYGVVGVIYLLLLAAAIFIKRYVKRLFEPQHPNAKLANKISLVGTVLGAVGIALVVLRYLQVPLVSARVLLYLLIVVSIGLLAYLVYYLRRVYPRRLAAFANEELRRRYATRPKAKPSPLPSRMTHGKRHGKRRR